MTCQHKKRQYYEIINGQVKYQCLDECVQIIVFPNIQLASQLHENEFFPCECAPYGLPSLRVQEDKYDYLLTCYHCPDVSVRIPKFDINWSVFLSNGKWGQRHNCVKVLSLRQLTPGDHVYFQHLLYQHHALVITVDLEAGTFSQCHYTKDGGFFGDKYENILESKSFTECQANLWKVNYLPMDVYSCEDSVQRGLEAIGDVFYSLFRNNCEHFISRLKFNISQSNQISSFFNFLTRPKPSTDNSGTSGGGSSS